MDRFRVTTRLTIRLAPLVSAMLVVVATVATTASAPAKLASSTQRVVRVIVPRDFSFREDGRGLVTSVWVNGAGPFAFVIDTGAGVNIVSQRVAKEARLTTGRAVSVAGLSGRTSKAFVSSSATLAAGASTNVLPATGPLTISTGLPSGVDGLLDPAVALWPVGFVIDFRSGEIRPFDPVASPVVATDVPEGGTVTPWIMLESSRRPFVALGDNRKALIDTGSKLGLVVQSKDARDFGIGVDGALEGERIRDVGGGTVHVLRRTASRVTLGGMTLRNVPTDVMSGAANGTPILLGRDVLRPFVISFDPRSRLIRIALS